jgi:hypothetical protein
MRRTGARTATLGALAAALAFGLAGCSSSGAGSGADSAPQGMADMEMSGAVDETFSEEARTAPDQPTSQSADRQVIVTGWVTVIVDDPIVAADQVTTAVERTGGFVSGRQQVAGDEDQSSYASLTLRVPADRLTEMLEEFDTFGDVQQTQLDSVEVTGQVRDLEARIDALETSIDRLEALLAESGSLSDLITVEQALTERQSQLEQLESEHKALADQVAMSTVTVELVSPTDVPADPPNGFVTGLQTGWNALVSFIGWLLTVFGVLLPWLLPVGAVALLTGWFVRRLARRHTTRGPVALPVPPAGPPAPPTPDQSVTQPPTSSGD